MPVVVRGLDEFRRELRRADMRMGKAFQKANKKVSERVAAKGKPAVQRLSSPGGSIAARGVRPRVRQNRATIAFLGSNPTIRATIFGTKAFSNFAKVFAGAFAADKIIDFARSSVRAFSDLNESVNAVEVTFGEASDGIKALGVQAAETVGLSNAEFNTLALAPHNPTRPIGNSHGTEF